MTARRLSVILGVLLAVSVILNLLSFGFAGWMWRNPQMVSLVSEHLTAYPRAMRPALRAAYQADRESYLADLKRLGVARARMAELMRAPQIDVAALEAAMTEVRIATTALQARAQADLAKTLPSIPLDVRQRIKPPRSPLRLSE
ncbi:MAG TPA: periplasmic heavy metal sensor [Rhizobiaceae bacterium]|nr:periplasmic heavy metal sensor [Rhizobiaceae bacterium]